MALYIFVYRFGNKQWAFNTRFKHLQNRGTKSNRKQRQKTLHFLRKYIERIKEVFETKICFYFYFEFEGKCMSE